MKANEVLQATKGHWDEHSICNRTSIYHFETIRGLKLFNTLLTGFVADKTYDLYSQSPWVAGGYMTAISDYTLLLDLETLNDKDCSAYVLHLYNMLQQLPTGCPRIPLLEHLVALFTPVVFPGK
jgi:hypothetical protein